MPLSIICQISIASICKVKVFMPLTTRCVESISLLCNVLIFMPLTIVSITQLNKVKLCMTITFQSLRIAPVYKCNVLVTATIRFISLKSQFYAIDCTLSSKQFTNTKFQCLLVTYYRKYYTIKEGLALYDNYFPVFLELLQYINSLLVCA